MRKDLPIVAKYLLVVAASLAMFIAQNEAAAQAAGQNAGNDPPRKDAAPYLRAGSFGVTVSEATWRDDARKRDVPVRIYSPAPGDRKAPAPAYPVILFSHGLGGNRMGGQLWAEHWASYGYVVVAMQHAGSDESLWKGKPPMQVMGAMKAGMTLNNLGLRVADVHFVIDEVVRRTAAKETAFINADAKRIGMSGHSFGAQTTLAVAGQRAGGMGQVALDSRITAAIAFSPNARNKTDLGKQYGDIRMPFFSITGTRDGSILEDNTRWQDRTLPYENMPAGGKYLTVFDGGDHMVFGGHELGARRPATPRDGVIQSGVKALTVAYWEATLKNDAAARQWLDGGGAKALLAPGDTFAAK